jgi:hypothetical protein
MTGCKVNVSVACSYAGRILDLHAAEGLLHASVDLFPGKGGCMGPKVDLPAMANRKISAPIRNRTSIVHIIASYFNFI